VPKDFPRDVEDFVVRHIASLEQLEILLRLFEKRAQGWTVAEMNRVICSQDSSVAHWLKVLVSLNLAKAEGDAYRFTANSPALENQVATLATFYREHHIRVIELIFSKPKDSVMNFARAFDLRKHP
jgi:hypothetical protein